MNDILDLAIIGGGPAGLATAHAFLAIHKDIKIRIYERNEDLSPRGAGLRLEPHGLKALFAINKLMAKEILSSSIVLRKHIDYTHDGMEINTLDSLELYKKAEREFGFGYPTIRWSDIRKCLAKHLPEGILQLGCRYYKLEEGKEEEGDIIKVYYCKGKKQIPCVSKTRYVVGADGYFSKVRIQTLRDGMPLFQNAIHWRAFVPREKLRVDIEPYTSRLYLGDNRIAFIYWITDGIVWSLSTTNDVCEDLGLELHLKLGQSGIQSDSDFSSGKESNYKNNCLKAFSEFSTEVLNLIKSTDKEDVLQHGVFMRDEANFTKKSFGTNKIALVGDAVHVLGTSVAFGDAHALALASAKGGFTSETTRLYSNLRYDFVKRNISTTTKIGSVIFNNEGLDANSEALCNSRGFEEFKNKIDYEDLTRVKITYLSQ